MLEMLLILLTWIGGAIAIGLVLGAWALGLILVLDETKASFEEALERYRNHRFANKLFYETEEFRRDFS